MKSENNPAVYQLKISLDKIKPIIWRRVQLKDNISLNDLHDIIQVLFNWTDDEDEIEVIDEYEYSAYDLLSEKGDSLEYEYDFGDSWKQTIVLEKIVKNEELVQNPICNDGANCAPPEDCGGLPEYYQLVKSMKNPKSKEYKENVVWLGKKYDPKYFDLAKVNMGLKILKLK